MLLETFYESENEEHFVQDFLFAKALPSGHTEIVYRVQGTFGSTYSVHYKIEFVDFVREWNRMH